MKPSDPPVMDLPISALEKIMEILAPLSEDSRERIVLTVAVFYNIHIEH